MEGAGGRHGEKLEEDDPDLAFALAVSMEEYRVQLHVPRVATRRSSEEDLQEALRRSRLETGNEQEQKGRGEGRDRVNIPAESPATAKLPEIDQFPTPSRINTMDLVTPQGPVGEEAGKYQSCYVQDVPRDKNSSRRRPATHKVEKANRWTAQNHGGNKDSPGSGQPRDREERGGSPVGKGYRPAEMQPGAGPGRRDQDHAGQEVPWIQSSAEPEVLHPPALLQDSGVKYGEGGPHHPGTRGLAHEKFTKAPIPVTHPGRILQKEAP